MMEVEDTSGRRLSTLELNKVSKDEVTKQSSPSSLSYSQDNYDSKERYSSISTNHVRNFEDSRMKCFICEELHCRGCAEAPVSMDGFCLSSEQGCESEEVGGNKDREKRNESFKENDYHKEKQNESKCQEGYVDKIRVSCDYEKVSSVILQVAHIVEEDILDTSSPSSERTEEMNNNVGLAVNIVKHDDHNSSYLAGSNFEKVGREEFQEEAQKKEEDLKTLDGRFYEASKKSSSVELEDLTEASKTTGNDVLTWQDLGLSGNKFQEQTADYGQGVGEVNAVGLTPIMKMEIDSSHGCKSLGLHELLVFENSETNTKTLTEAEKDLCNNQQFSSHMTKTLELENEPKASSLCSGKDRIDSHNLIVSPPIEVSTVASNQFGCIEFHEKDVASSKGRDHIKNFAGRPDLKIFSNCNSPLDAEEIRDVMLLETKQGYAEPKQAEDCDVKEDGGNLFLECCGSEEQKHSTNIEGYCKNFAEKPENLQTFSDSQRLPEINSGQNFEIYESATLLEESSKVKDGGQFGLEGNVQIIQDKLRNNGEKLCGSEEPPQAVGYDKDSEANNFTVSPVEKMEEIAPFALSRRVDSLMEKLLCLTKVLRGEIIPSVAGSSLLREEETSCDESYSTSKREIVPEQEDHVGKTLMLENAITSSPPELQVDQELGNCMESKTDIAYKCAFSVEPTAGEPIQDCHVAQGVAVKPEELLEKINFVSPGKNISIGLESERNSSASCNSKKTNLNNIITNSPAEDIKHVGAQSLSEILDGQSFLPSKQAYSEENVEKLKMEAITSSSDPNTDATSPCECDFSCNCTTEGEPHVDVDIDVRELLEIAQYGLFKPGEDLEKTHRVGLEDDKNSSASCISKKTKLNNSPAKDSNYFRIQCLSETSADQISIPIEQECANNQVDILEVESQDSSISRTDTFTVANPSELKASASRNTVDPVEEISRKLIKVCISSSRKPTKCSIIKTPRTKSSGTFKHHSSVGIIREKNTQRTKLKYYSSKSKIKNSASDGSIRRPLRSVTNQMLD